MKRSGSEFDEFFAARAPALRRTAFVIVRDWHAAEDVVQAAFVKILKAWPRIREESVDAYARRAVVNTSISYTRKHRREVTTDTVPTEAAGLEYEPVSALLETLAGLPPAQRAVIALRFLDDLSVAEVAQALGITEGTVKSQSSRGLAELRRHFTSEPDPTETTS